MFTLVVGGAFQGKLEYARGIALDGEIIDCSNLGDLKEELSNIESFCEYVLAHKEIKGIANLGYIVRYAIESDKSESDKSKSDKSESDIIESNNWDSVLNALDKIVENDNSNISVITLKEEGLGIIPMDKSDRRYRECIGKIGCYLATKADRVVRIVCGIPTVIKG